MLFILDAIMISPSAAVVREMICLESVKNDSVKNNDYSI